MSTGKKQVFFLTVLSAALSLYGEPAPNNIEYVAAQRARDQLAYAKAEGLGAYTQGGVNGRGLTVVSLEDSDKDGTLRWALAQPYPRTIRFSVGGTIVLKRPLVIKNPYVTVDGFSAPGPGITITGNRIEIDTTNDVIIRYIRLHGTRVVNPQASSEKIEHLIRIYQSAYVLVDHCSIIGEFLPLILVRNASFVTVQNSLVNGLASAAWIKAGANDDSLAWSNGFQISFVKNIFAFCAGNCIEFVSLGFAPTRGAVENNMLCFYGNAGVAFKAAYLQELFHPDEAIGDFQVENNIFNNVLKPTASGIAIDPAKQGGSIQDPVPDFRLFFSGNNAPGNQYEIVQQWTLVKSPFTAEVLRAYRYDSEMFRGRFFPPGDLRQLESYLMHTVGVNVPTRDAVDTEQLHVIGKGFKEFK